MSIGPEVKLLPGPGCCMKPRLRSHERKGSIGTGFPLCSELRTKVGSHWGAKNVTEGPKAIYCPPARGNLAPAASELRMTFIRLSMFRRTGSALGYRTYSSGVKTWTRTVEGAGV